MKRSILGFLLGVVAAASGCELCSTLTHNLQQRCLDGDDEACEVLQKNAPAPLCQG